MSDKLRIGITIGDYNGIGPELILKTLSNKLVLNYCTPVVYGNTYVFKHYAQLLNINPITFNIVKKKEDVKDGAVNLRFCNEDRINITPGEPSIEAGKFAFDALELAVEDVKEGIIQNILTAPIDKKSTTDAGLPFNGHTQYFAQKFESNVQMILVDDDLRVAMVTGHTPLNSVSSALTSEKITESIKSMYTHLQSDFGIKKPKIAVLGLNPHGGDNGLMGSEEINLIKPVIEALNKNDVIAVGPYSPDGFFGSNNVKNFDGVIGMYHDQVLTPFKQTSFANGINYTAGLPIVRTSPDHGTAYDIAGKGIASISSFVGALYLINKIHRNRLKFYDSSTTPLPYKDHRREKFSIGVPDLN
ncbi:MAG: 4-hydroxythreonine-4-phosphate dehydrogenase PdxA [Bacteroidia bacterium]|nr:4-hydroxythreonine-4-phosphate dehydrogenase PdxA [Bacteroidia bacterium]